LKRAFLYLAIVAFATTLMAQAQQRDLDIHAADGIKLRATHYDPGQPGPGVLLLHRCLAGASRRDWDSLARKLQDNGFHVLALDLRTYGESEGERIRFGGNLEDFFAYVRRVWTGDMEAALAMLKSFPGVDTEAIGTAGASCGLFMSIELLPHHPEIQTEVFLTGPIDDTSIDYLKNALQIPTFGILSRDDPSVPFMKRIDEATGAARGRMLYLPEGTGHGTNMFAKAKELEPMIVNWFKTHLKSAYKEKSK
jgi:alpha-beta hydrolase superfamily lysophospholipase